MQDDYLVGNSSSQEIIVMVAFPFAWSQFYTYKLNTNLSDLIGYVVEAKIKNKTQIGLIVKIVDKFLLENIDYEIKNIDQILYRIDPRIILWLEKCSQYYIVDFLVCLKILSLFPYKSVLSAYYKYENKYYNVEKLNNIFSYAKWQKMLKEKELQAATFIQTLDPGLLSQSKLQAINRSFDRSLEKTLQKLFEKESQEYKKILIEGDTGSGKTQIYLEAITKLATEKQILILLPEILLTNAFIKRFESMFGIEPLVYHSKISKKAKESIYFWACDKKSTGVLIGARSALFNPFGNLGAVIIDEEHDSSYKSNPMYVSNISKNNNNTDFFYNAKTCAQFLCEIMKCPLILVSATASFDLKNENIERYKIQSLLSVDKKLNIKTHLIDMRANDSINKQNNGILSDKAIALLKDNLEKKQLSLVFLNKKGFAQIVLCSKCDKRLLCKNCSVGMIYYESGYVACHYCGFYYKLPPACSCSGKWKLFGVGMEKVSQILTKIFPKAVIECVHGQMNKTKMNAVIKAVQENKVDILIGTQIMAQGHHIPYLSLIIMLDADFGLMLSHYKTLETSYQLMMQLRGRCGRADIPGNFYIQTHFPEHILFKCIINICENKLERNISESTMAQFKQTELLNKNKYTMEQFKQTELENREIYLWPPYVKLCSVLFSFKIEHAGKIKSILLDISNVLKNHDLFENNFNKSIFKPIIYGPVKAPVFKINNIYRYRMLFKYKQREDLEKFVSILKKTASKKEYYQIFKMQIDIDPEDFN